MITALRRLKLQQLMALVSLAPILLTLVIGFRTPGKHHLWLVSGVLVMVAVLFRPRGRQPWVTVLLTGGAAALLAVCLAQHPALRNVMVLLFYTLLMNAVPAVSWAGTVGLAVAVDFAYRLAIWGGGLPLELLTTPRAVTDLAGFLIGGVLLKTVVEAQGRIEELNTSLGALLEQEAQTSNRLAAELERTLDMSMDIILTLQFDASIRSANSAVSAILGYPPERLIGTRLEEWIHPDDLGAIQAKYPEILRGKSVSGVEARVLRADGTWAWMEASGRSVPREKIVFCVLRDVTGRKRSEEQLEFLAFHDPLTRLPNRALFLKRLDEAVSRAPGDTRSFALLFLDLDGFKVVNDSLGHDAGDGLLEEIAQRLLRCAGAKDVVARIGGDEFAVLVEGESVRNLASRCAAAIHRQLKRPVAIDGQDVFVSASIGIVHGERSRDPVELLRFADIAMYQAKQKGKARSELFQPAMNRRAVERLALETDLRRALEQGELRLFFQPIVELSTARVVALEALVRWEHPVRGWILPEQFIQAAEENGQIIPMGLWVFEEACRQFQVWRSCYPDAPLPMVSVNLSPRQFQHPRLAADFARILAQYGVPAGKIQLEITESTLLKDVQSTTRTLEVLSDLGFHLALDDFGTGYSSWAYLSRFPIQTIKIDRSFIGGVDWNPANRSIVRAMIALARSLDLRVVGEGVENEAQAAVLAELECDLGQGFLYARPMPAGEAETLLGAGEAGGCGDATA